MKLDILSPEGTIFSGEVSLATFPGVVGSFTVLEDHAALISALQPGQIVARQEEGEKTFSIEGGFVEINDNEIAVCVQ